MGQGIGEELIPCLFLFTFFCHEVATERVIVRRYNGDYLLHNETYYVHGRR